MAAPSAPSKLPEWASGGSADIVEPSEGKKDLGWIQEKPPLEWFNWIQNLTYQWHSYLKELSEFFTWTDGSPNYTFVVKGDMSMTANKKIKFGTGNDIGQTDTDEVTLNAPFLEINGAVDIYKNAGKECLTLSYSGSNIGLTIGGDTTLYRAGANNLETDDDFDAQTINANNELNVYGSYATLDPGTSLRWGTATILREYGSGVLQFLGDHVDIASDNGKETLTLSDTAANIGLTIGGDTNLYRESANLLVTDDSFKVLGSELRASTIVSTNYIDKGNASRITDTGFNQGNAGGGPYNDGAIYTILNAWLNSTQSKNYNIHGMAKDNTSGHLYVFHNAVRTSGTAIRLDGYEWDPTDGSSTDVASVVVNSGGVSNVFASYSLSFS